VVRLTAVGLALGLFALAFPVGAAAAEPETTAAAMASTITPTPTPSPPLAATRQAPAITSPGDGTFIGRASTVISGTRLADQDIQLLSPTGGDPLCVREADGTTTWTCPATLASSPSVRLKVVDSSDATLSSEIHVRVLTAPVITGGPNGSPASNGAVRGTGYPGATITATLSNGRQCSSDADASGAWFCVFDGISASGSYTVSATQRSDFSAPTRSNDSTPVELVIDVDAPPAPTLLSPAADSQVPTGRVTFNGAGEDGATVTIFVDAYSACTTPVAAGGGWACTADGVQPGSLTVRAVQQDAAGNVSAGSPPITVVFGAAATATPQPSATSGSNPLPAPPVRVPQEATQAPVIPAPKAAPEAAPQAAPPRVPELAGPAGSVAGGWNDPTRFAAAVTPPGSTESFPWLQAVLLAIAAVVLLAIPARLLAGTISRARGGRPLWHDAQLSGRNRARVEFETAPDVRVNRGLVAGAALAAAAALVMLSGPITDQPAYLRLFVAVVLALVLVNAVAILVPLWWGTRVLRVEMSVTFLPRYLLLVGVAALGSRILDLHPALLFGLLGSVAVAGGAGAAARGRLAAVRASSLVVLAVTGWLLLGILPAANGFTSTLAAEVVNTIVLAAIGSAVLVLIPIGSTSGRTILAWSPPVWAGLIVVAFSVLFGVLSPTFDAVRGGSGTALVWTAAGAFAAVSVGAWAWQRFVSPSLN
jgi:hypothetical protein